MRKLALVTALTVAGIATAVHADMMIKGSKNVQKAETVEMKKSNIDDKKAMKADIKKQHDMKREDDDRKAMKKE